MNIGLREFLDCEVAGGFEQLYKLAQSVFDNQKQFFKLEESSCAKLQWPDAPGVYLVWDKRNLPEELVYIGMTGQFSGNGTMSDQKLTNRATRYNPYMFDPVRDTFSFGPKYVSNESRNRPPEKGYETNITIEKVRVDCFAFKQNRNLAPAFLEALLLQGYLLQFGKLPAGNNKF